MASRIVQTLPNQNLLARSTVCLHQLLFLRHGHRLRGKPPGVARTLEQRLAEERIVDPEISRKINIGFPHLKPSRSDQLKERLAHLKTQRTNPELEKQARNNSLKIDAEKVRTDWLKTSGPFQIKTLAEHYGIFEHLFGAAYFVPRVDLKITFNSDSEAVSQVFYGNTIKPSEAIGEPQVSFDWQFDFKGQPSGKTEDTWWTLVLTNPDGHLTEDNKEYCHWFVSNIPNGEVAKGERIISYLQPIPPKGTGYHRYVFVLYKQDKKLDLSSYKVSETEGTVDLAARTFETLDFYRKYQDDITPAGLAFFQSDWDKTLIQFYHDVLKMKHPTFEYDFPRPFLRDQEWFPLRRPFNLYMDKYRDPKQVAKEYLARKLAKTHPFEGPEPPLRFPNAHPVRDVPSWLRTEIKRDRRGWGRINDI
ncbi:39S ribosomal protein L38, mitochondrial [Uranotaenia lowii]|uniref:39S ribosomal protein L38, mitochondrial n=1 Tax=Uranotaenia lowii TaxID=190385 RepID=UPI0024784707|nr:39S ribosomal protein L38, mitochondrial [Uranotaenia lowii]